MAMRTWHWCPNGCGMTVFYVPCNSEKLNIKKGWNCRVCDYHKESGRKP